MTLALGIDIGTSGVRSAVLDDSGACVSMAQVGHLPQDGAEIDAENWWLAVKACVSDQIGALRDIGRSGQDISGIAVDGTSGSMVLTDAHLNTVSPGLMYNSKGFEAEAAQIAKVAPKGHITIGSNSALARAMRLVSMATDRPAHLLHQADFVAARLMGQGGHSDHNNALKTGFDPASESWPDWMDQVMDPGLLPQCHPVGRPIAPLDPKLAADLGLNPNAMVHAGTTDSIAAFLACAPMEIGAAVTSLGSTLAIKILSPQRIDDASIGLYAHRIGDLWLVGGASNTGGAVLLDHFSPEDMAILSQLMDPGAPTGLDYYPLLKPGERFPVNDPSYPPRLTPRPDSDVAFLQGLFEGIARIEAQCYREIENRGGQYPTQIFSAGGGALDQSFSQIREAALGLPLQSVQNAQAALGAAKLAQAAKT